MKETAHGPPLGSPPPTPPPSPSPPAVVAVQSSEEDLCEVRIKWRHKVDAFSFPSGWMSPLTTLLLLLLLQQTLGDIVRGKACSQQVCAALLFVRTYVYVCVGGDADKDQLYTSLLVWWSQLD